ncbi:MAG: 23S rRNA (guanosine(2251)-2'-O)-methyltransferase RlmB [Coriobacteriales bacterium]|nr:23S rRNA (guanosine(2251)-2'-O)-methyltransferase RlmB [Coriobacteriales bacterium]
MAKNQSRKPGRDVRGGNGKRQRSGAAQGQARNGKRDERYGWDGRGGKGGYGKGGAKAGGPGKRAGGARGGQRSHGSRGFDLIEGRRACSEALDAGLPLKRALVATSVGERDHALEELVVRIEQADVPVEYVSRNWLDGHSSHGAHQGIMLEAEKFAYAELDDLIEAAGTGDALVLLLDHVTDEGNFGAIVRTAEVVGAAGVVVANARAAQVGTAAYKTSAGAVLHLPIAQVSNLATAVTKLQEAGFWVGAATEHAHDDVWHAPLDGRICLVMGSEGSGVSQLVRKKCDFECKLPQRGRVESLNVAQATTALCYEWLRRTMAKDEALQDSVQTKAAEVDDSMLHDVAQDSAYADLEDWA